MGSNRQGCGAACRRGNKGPCWGTGITHIQLAHIQLAHIQLARTSNVDPVQVLQTLSRLRSAATGLSREARPREDRNNGARSFWRYFMNAVLSTSKPASDSTPASTPASAPVPSASADNPGEFTDYKVADLSLAEWGRKEIAIAE